nr:hypothetical protein Iba_chr03aCG10350 [Ipomoea batatas]
MVNSPLRSTLFLLDLLGVVVIRRSTMVIVARRTATTQPVRNFGHRGDRRQSTKTYNCEPKTLRVAAGTYSGKPATLRVAAETYSGEPVTFRVATTRRGGEGAAPCEICKIIYNLQQATKSLLLVENWKLL